MLIAEKWVNLNFHSHEELMENYTINPGERFNFSFDVMDELARTKPEKVAMIWCDDEGEERIFTFADLKKYSNMTANFFKSCGIKKGDRVILCLKRYYEFWWSILALHKIGAVAIPTTHLSTKKDFIYRNNAAKVKMIVAAKDEGLLNYIDQAKPQSPTVESYVFVGEDTPREGWKDFRTEVANQSEVFDRPTGEEDTKTEDPMLLYFTSGTSAQPKMVIHDFSYPLAHVSTAYFWQCVDPNGKHLTVADTGWGKTAWGKLYGQWLCETIVFVYNYSDRFKETDLLHIIEKYKITTFCAPPTIYRFFIKANFEEFDLSSLQHCSIAGEPLNPEIYYKFLELANLKLHEGYGQTETTLVIGNDRFMEPRPGSMGKPMAGYDVDIVDENGNSCAPGEEGQIVIRTGKKKPVGLFMGYYDDEERTKSVWHDGMYYTNDMAWRDEDGYFWYVGRSDDVIKSSGYRISPFEVESALIEHPAVLECAITGVPDDLRGQIIKATVVLTKNYTPSDELKKELQTHVKKTTAPYKYPRMIEFVEQLPKTISGKIRRVEIRENDKK